MSPHLYRRLMRDKLARLRHRAGAAHEPQVRRSHRVAARAQPGICRGTGLRAVERNPAMTTPPATGNWITGPQTVWRSRSNGTPRPRRCGSWSWIARVQRSRSRCAPRTRPMRSCTRSSMPDPLSAGSRDAAPNTQPRAVCRAPDHGPTPDHRMPGGGLSAIACADHARMSGP
jgi:hypothetical protein